MTEVESSPFEQLAETERERILAHCSRSLTIAQRVLLHQYYVRGVRLNRVARMFGITSSAMGQRHQTALRVFRSELARRNIVRLKDL